MEVGNKSESTLRVRLSASTHIGDRYKLNVTYIYNTGANNTNKNTAMNPFKVQERKEEDVDMEEEQVKQDNSGDEEKMEEDTIEKEKKEVDQEDEKMGEGEDEEAEDASILEPEEGEDEGGEELDFQRENQLLRDDEVGQELQGRHKTTIALAIRLYIKKG